MWKKTELIVLIFSCLYHKHFHLYTKLKNNIYFVRNFPHIIEVDFQVFSVKFMLTSSWNRESIRMSHRERQDQIGLLQLDRGILRSK